MTTEGDLPATPRRRIDWRTLPWGPIGFATAGVATIALTATLLYPVIVPAGDESAQAGPGADAKRSAEMAGLPGVAGSASASSASPSSSPSPSPSASEKKPVQRAGGKPVAGNTGSVAGSRLTVVIGDQTYATDNQVVENVDVHGYVRVTGRKVVLRNAVVRGGAARCGPVIQVDPGASATIEDVEVAPAAAGVCLDGVWASATTLSRVNIHGVVNGVKAGDDVVVQDSWIHDLSYFTSGAPGGGETVTNAVENLGHRRVTLRHSVLYPGAHGNAAYQVTQEAGAAGDLRVEGNWLDGGHCTLNFAHRGGGAPTLTVASVANNRFGRDTKYVCPMLISTQTTLSQSSGNVWDDTGAPIPAPDRHD